MIPFQKKKRGPRGRSTTSRRLALATASVGMALAFIGTPGLSFADPPQIAEAFGQADDAGFEFFPSPLDYLKGRHLFERETFDGNGRTCLTCHGRETGTTSPRDAWVRYLGNPRDPLFRGDGSDDGEGHGVSRMLKDATILVGVPLPANVSLQNDPAARSVVLRRGIPSTLNTPALDPVLMLDGREPNLQSQARGAILGHAQAAREPKSRELDLIAAFQHTPGFFSSPTMRRYAYAGVTPSLPAGRTPSEVRGRRFFIDAPLEGDFKAGLCAHCHSGPMLNETNGFGPFPPFARGGRFQSVGVSEFNAAGNPVLDFEFRNPDGTTTVVSSPGLPVRVRAGGWRSEVRRRRWRGTHRRSLPVMY
jgi:cytochrome c peroxidase